MKKSELRALLAVTVIAVPLVFATGCGKKTTPAPVGSEPVVQETVSSTPIPESSEGIAEVPEPSESTPEIPVVEDFLDESMKGIYFVVAKEGIPAYAEDGIDSEVLETIPYGTQLTGLGMSKNTHLFKVQIADSAEEDIYWVSSEFLSASPNELQDAGGEAAPPAEPAENNVAGGDDLAKMIDPYDTSYENEDWFKNLPPEYQEIYRQDMERMKNQKPIEEVLEESLKKSSDAVVEKGGYSGVITGNEMHHGYTDWGSGDYSDLQTGVIIE